MINARKLHLHANPDVDSFYTEGGYAVVLSPDSTLVGLAGLFATAQDALELERASRVHFDELKGTAGQDYAPEEMFKSLVTLSAIRTKVLETRRQAIGGAKAASLDSLYLPTSWAKENLRAVRTTTGEAIAPQVITPDMLRSTGVTVLELNALNAPRRYDLS